MRKSFFRALALIAMIVSAAGIASAQDIAPRHQVSFAWGADLATGVDMGGNDMSVIGINAYAGIKTPVIKIAGVGAGIDIPISNSRRMIPLFGIIRTNFVDHPTLCFMDLRCGVSVNYMDGDQRQTGAYTSAGVGINLATSRKFSSHLILGYTYIGRKDYTIGELVEPTPDLHMVAVRLGITF